MIRFRPAAPQRDMMRDLVRLLGEDLDAVCLAYMEAERDGKVDRPRGAEDLTPATHVKALWNEGKLEGWIAG